MEFVRFILCWLFIGMVSAFDLSLVVKFQKGLDELNPMAKVIIDNFGVSGFVFAKMCMTIIVLGSLALGYSGPHRRNAILVTDILAIFQGGLLLFLLIA